MGFDQLHKTIAKLSKMMRRGISCENFFLNSRDFLIYNLLVRQVIFGDKFNGEREFQRLLTNEMNILSKIVCAHVCSFAFTIKFPIFSYLT